MAPTVMGYAAIAVRCQEDHLSLPTIGIQWPAVAEHDGLSCAPDLVIDPGAVFGRNRTHCLASFFLCMGSRLDRPLDPKPGTAPARRDSRIPDATGGPARPPPPPGSKSIFMGATNY